MNNRIKNRRRDGWALLIVGVPLILAFICTRSVCAASANEGWRFLESLFPGSTLSVVESVFGHETSSAVLKNISLRGMRGFVPMSEFRDYKLSNNIAVLAFPIYLHDRAMPQDDLIKQRPAPEPSHIKLVQVVFVDPNTNKLIGKPAGFPLQSTGWTCAGDACDTVSIVGFEAVENSADSVVFKYGEGIVGRKLKVLAFDGEQIHASSSYRYSDLGGESGFEATANFTDWKLQNNIIVAKLTTYCDADEPGFCSGIGLPTGHSSKTVDVLSLQKH